MFFVIDVSTYDGPDDHSILFTKSEAGKHYALTPAIQININDYRVIIKTLLLKYLLPINIFFK